MSHHPVDLAVILASVRPGRFGPTVGRWFLGRLDRHPGLRADVLDLAEPGSPGQVARRLERAEGFVVVTPEYNHSYPAALKELVDEHFPPWAAKPVGFVSYGGLSGGLRAVEHLRGVFAEVHAVTVRDTVSLHQPWNLLGPDGELAPEPASDQAADRLLERMSWWAGVLTPARTATPYAA